MKNATVKSFSAHNSKIHSVAWNIDGKRLASGSTDKTVAVFTFENKERLSKESVFKGHTDLVDQLCWHTTHPDLLVTASGDRTGIYTKHDPNPIYLNLTLNIFS